MHLVKLCILGIMVVAASPAEHFRRTLQGNDFPCEAESIVCQNDAPCLACVDKFDDTEPDYQKLGCGEKALLTYLQGDFQGSAACQKDAKTAEKPLAKMITCYSKDLYPAYCENGYSLARCETEFNACTDNTDCASCVNGQTPDKEDLSKQCEADTNEAELSAQLAVGECADNTLLSTAITCWAKAYATDCNGINAAGALKLGAAAVSAVVVVAAGLFL